MYCQIWNEHQNEISLAAYLDLRIGLNPMSHSHFR